MTGKRVDRAFFAAHSVTELSGWSDFDLEDQGRLTEPMVYDPESDHYVPIGWHDAFTLAGRACAPWTTRTRHPSTPPAGSATRPPSSTS